MLDREGVLLCARYAASPNFFGYCGPARSANVLDHLKDGVGDRELAHILADFQTLYPYLRLISQANGIRDPFNRRVVEAYWIGNQLLEKVKQKTYLSFLDELLLLAKRVDREASRIIKSKVVTYPVLPHHSFHVFNIFKTYAKRYSPQVIKGMESCRVSWGRVKSVVVGNSAVNEPTARTVCTPSECTRQVNVPLCNFCVVSSRILEWGDGLRLSDEPVDVVVKIDYQGKQFIRGLRVGEWVSFHWGYVCHRITPEQVRSLSYYTQRAVDYFNTPLLDQI